MTPDSAPSTPHSASDVSLLALDADGVLTDGSIFLDDDGREIKRFNVRDGFGIKLWQRMGFAAAIITSRSGRALQHRARELGINLVSQGEADKSAALTQLMDRTGLPAGHIAYLADDWPDLGVLRRVGYPMAVADAEPAVRRAASFVTSRPGGRGAVREAVEHLLTAKGLLDRALRLYDP